MLGAHSSSRRYANPTVFINVVNVPRALILVKFQLVVFDMNLSVSVYIILFYICILIVDSDVRFRVDTTVIGNPTLGLHSVSQTFIHQDIPLGVYEVSKTSKVFHEPRNLAFSNILNTKTNASLVKQCKYILCLITDNVREIYHRVYGNATGM